MSKRGYPMPEIINPDAARHVCIPVPDDPAYRQAFLGNLLQLARPWNWGEGRVEHDEDVAAVWRNIWLDTALQLDNAYEDCGERVVVEPRCRQFLPAAPFIDFQPASPFRPDEEQVPFGYAARPWFQPGEYLETFYPLDWATAISAEIIGLLLQYKDSDVLTLWPSQPGINVQGFPRFSVAVRGTGTLELHMLNVPLGSRAIVSVDIDLNIQDILSIDADNLYIIESNWDAVSFPPETADTVVHEIEITEPGDHLIHVTIVPVLNDEAIFIQYGAGLRKVELCGNLEPIYPEGSEGNEGEIIVSDGCGCDGMRDIFNDMLLGAAYGLYNESVPPGSTIGDPGNDPDTGEPIGGENGRINPPQSGDLPSDDPDLGAQWGNMEERAGSAWKAANRFFEGFSDLLQFMQETACWDGLNWLIPFQEPCYDYVNEMMGAIYDIDRAALDQFILWFVNDSTVTPVISPAELAPYFFCTGINSQAVSRFAIEERQDEQRDFYLKLRGVFTQGQYQYWAQQGLLQPRSDYKGFPCLLRDTILYQFSPADIGSGFNQRVAIPDMAWPQRDEKTLIYITLSGTVSDGSIQEDPLYRYDDPNDLQRRMLGIRFDDGSTANVFPAEEDFPAHNAAHSYTFSFELPANVEGAAKLFWDVDTNAGWTYDGYDSAQGTATGQFTIRIADGGII